jgi:BD-FAE
VIRRAIAIAAALATPVGFAVGCGGGQANSEKTSAKAKSASSYSLAFPTKDYTSETITVGSKKIAYRFYKELVYVAHPVSTPYESLDVAVPVKIGNETVNAKNAPILFDIPVGGYLSSAVQSSFGGGGGGSAPSGSTPSGSPPSGASGSPPSSSGSSSTSSGTSTTSGSPSSSSSSGGGTFAGQGQGNNDELALAAGYVVVIPGVRGRDNVTSSGRYFGKAPAAIVDLKAAIRYLHYNQGRVPGNTNHIVTTGVSAGGALSTLLGASAGSHMYDSYEQGLGAANASDSVYAVSAYSPITDLDHADGEYEWTFGAQDYNGKLVNQTLSKELRAEFATYEASLDLTSTGFGRLTAANYANYLVKTVLEPSATKYLRSLSSSARKSYLAENPWIHWSDNHATFTWAGFLNHVGRSKDLPAFDGFTLEHPENIEFGNATTNARHFTLFSLRHATGNSKAELASDLQRKIQMMNPMYFMAHKNPHQARYWFLRTGTKDTDTSPVIVSNLATISRDLGDSVNEWLYWDAGHGANNDPAEFIHWIGRVTGYTK